MPSLKPIRLRGVCWADVVFEVRPKPICDQRIAARPNAIRDRLRTAWTATCGSSAQTWTQRSPWLHVGLEGVADERRQAFQLRRALGCDPEPVDAIPLEQPRPEART